MTQENQSSKQADNKDLKDVPNKTNTNIKQALFVGSSKELHSLLKNKNKNITPQEDKDFDNE